MPGEQPDDPYAASAPPTQISRPAAPAGPSHWEDPPRRGRGWRVAVVAGLGVVGLVVGIGAGVLADRADDSPNDTPPTTAPAETITPPTTAPVIVPAPTTTAAGGTAAATPTPSPNDFSPLPAHPETVGADFGYIVLVSGGTKEMQMTFAFDRAQFVRKPGGGHQIKNEDPRDRTLFVDPRASFVGTARLNNENGKVKRELLSADVFLENLQDAIHADGRVAVWLRHADADPDSDITAVSEQYLP